MKLNLSYDKYGHLSEQGTFSSGVELESSFCSKQATDGPSPKPDKFSPQIHVVNRNFH